MYVHTHTYTHTHTHTHTHTYTHTHHTHTYTHTHTHTLQIEILEVVHTIESRVSEIVECKNRCVALYNSCDTIADRYFSFDELTARLGSGARPVEGVTDWRKNVCMYVYVLEILQLIFC